MAYGRGGDKPTLTDAALFYGLLPDALAGGEIRLQPGAAAEGIRRLADALDVSPEEAAKGVLTISAHNQANAVLQLTVKRGIDPTGDALVAFGGAGPLQACAIAEILGLRTVLIPASSGNVSAFGLLAVDVKDDHVLTLVRRHDGVDGAEVAAAFEGLEAAARRSLHEQSVPAERMRLLRSVDARYLGEAYELSIALGAGFDADAATRAFHDAHERVYGYAYRTGEVVEFVNWKVTAVGLIDRPSIELPAPASNGARRPVSKRGARPVWRREDLPAGFELDGPATVEEYGSTFVVESGWHVIVDRLGNLVGRL
jgi:N-methylhydantoinase A